jgi:hypothetical protein
MVNLANSFPSGIRDIKTKEDQNPAVQLFGRRFFGDQPPLEILSELLLVMTSTKTIGGKSVESIFPDITHLRSWADMGGKLCYEPKAKLNLKLFAFLGSSRLETRHETHRKHCEELWRDLREKITTTDMEKDEALSIMSNLFLGFWGTGAERTWCAQTFLPFCKSVLTTEAIWKKSKSAGVNCWTEALDLFQYSQRIFLARGGEMIYLHICNALRQSPETLREWFISHTAGGQSIDNLLTSDEKDPVELLMALQTGFDKFFSQTPKTLDRLADFIDTGVEDITADSSDRDSGGSPRQAACGWCPTESWREGYLLAVELKRILNSNIDAIETVDLLEIACAMHVMRSLAAQSYRVTATGASDGFDYRILVSDTDGENRRVKELSRTSLSQVCRQIYSAIRIPEIRDTLDASELVNAYKDADNRYGRKLYLRIGKSLGLIVPRRGAGIRVVLNDRILRYMLLSLVPGQRMTLDTLKLQMELHHGLVFEESSLRADREMSSHKELLDSSEYADVHLEQMLDAAGVLVRLSDSCSLVRNPFL